MIWELRKIKPVSASTFAPSEIDWDSRHPKKLRWRLLCDSAQSWRRHFDDKGPSSPTSPTSPSSFSISHVLLWELDQKEGWAPKNWCFWTVVLKKALESLLDIKEMKPVNPKGNQPWIFIGRTDAEAEAPILWQLDAKRQHWKRPWCWERMRARGEGDDREWDG